jgi:predicted nucleotidyltransferase
MAEPLIFAIGTQVVVQKDTYHTNHRVAHPAGSVGVIVRSPIDRAHAYRVKFNDGFEAAVNHDQLVRLSEFKSDPLRAGLETSTIDLNKRVIYRCVIGSRAYGLEDERSDTDRRGIYLPPAELHWSLYGIPEQLENEEAQEAYWEIQKFLVLALKSNPNVLECLYSPMVEFSTPLAGELLAMRESFLSKLVFQTYSGYIASQFKKMQADIRNHGRIKWKHVMHLIRLLISGIDVLREGKVTMEVGDARQELLAIKRGEVAFEEVDAWRKRLQIDFEQAFLQTALPDRPDYQRVNEFLIRARRLAVGKELP